MTRSSKPINGEQVKLLRRLKLRLFSELMAYKSGLRFRPILMEELNMLACLKEDSTIKSVLEFRENSK